MYKDNYELGCNGHETSLVSHEKSTGSCWRSIADGNILYCYVIVRPLISSSVSGLPHNSGCVDDCEPGFATTRKSRSVSVAFATKHLLVLLLSYAASDILLKLQKRSLQMLNCVAGLNLRIYNEDHERGDWSEPYWFIVIGGIILIPFVICCFLAKEAISGLGYLVSRHVHLLSHGRQRHDDTELGKTDVQRGAEGSLLQSIPERQAKYAKDQYRNSLRNTFGDTSLRDAIMMEIGKWENGV